MDKSDRFFLGSVRALNKTYAERDPAVVLAPALHDAFTTVATLYGQARVHERGMIPPKGVADDKNDKKRTAATAVFYICEGLSAYAHKQGDTVLKKFAKHSITDLARTKDEDITTAMENIVAKARTLLPALAYAEVTSNELDAADDLIDAMDTALGNPRDSADNRKLAGEKFAITLHLLREELGEHTDKLINRLLVAENPPTPAGDLRRAFAAKYEASRDIKGISSQKEDPAAPASTPPPPPANPV